MFIRWFIAIIANWNGLWQLVELGLYLPTTEADWKAKIEKNTKNQIVVMLK